MRSLDPDALDAENNHMQQQLIHHYNSPHVNNVNHNVNVHHAHPVDAIVVKTEPNPSPPPQNMQEHLCQQTQPTTSQSQIFKHQQKSATKLQSRNQMKVDISNIKQEPSQGMSIKSETLSGMPSTTQGESIVLIDSLYCCCSI